MILKKDTILLEYYNLLKSWFGYETVVFNKEVLNIMKENGKILFKAINWLKSIYAFLERNGLNQHYSEDGLKEIGIYIHDKRDIYYGWIGIWFPLWEETGSIFIYTISDKNSKKYYTNFINKYKECKTYIEREDDSPDGKIIHKYICFDDDIFSKNYDSGKIGIKLLEILKDIKSTKQK